MTKLIRRSTACLCVMAVAAWVSACQSAAPSQPSPAAGGLANPASTYCVALKYDLQIRSDASGAQAGYCVFPDKTECEEWAFFRGECGQAKSLCGQDGGTIKASDSGPSCTFKDGSTCAEADLVSGKCKPGGS